MVAAVHCRQPRPTYKTALMLLDSAVVPCKYSTAFEAEMGSVMDSGHSQLGTLEKALQTFSCEKIDQL